MKKLKALVFSALFISLAVVPVKAEEETDKKVIACVGDSITYGLVKDPQTGAESGTTYPDDLNLLLGNDYEVVNLGKPGAYVTKDDGTLCMWNQEEYKKALDVKADSFIVMLGTNDSHEESFDEEKFKTSYLEFLESLQETHLDVDFYIMTPPCSYSDKADEKLLHDQIYRIVNEIGLEKDIPVIDFHSYTHDHEEWYRDGLHPNDVGYAVLSAYIYDQIGEKLK